MYQTVMLSLRSTGVSPVTNLFMSCASFMLIFLGSFAIGCAVAYYTSYLIKRYNPIIREDDPQKKKRINRAEVTIMVVSPIASYLIAQGIGLSGIVSILFCGFILSQYAAENLSYQTRKLIKFLYQSSAYICESTVFMFLGMSAVEFYGAYRYDDIILIFV